MSESSPPPANGAVVTGKKKSVDKAPKHPNASKATLYARRGTIAALLLIAGVFCFFLEAVEVSVILTAAATIMLALFTWTLSDATDQMRRGADDTLAHLKEASERELRAYIFVTKVTPIANNRIVDPKARLINYDVVFKNSGMTPAYDVVIQSRIDIGPKDFSGAFPAIEPSAGASRAPHGPGAEMHHLIPEQPFQPDEVERLRRGEVVYFHGSVRYVDAFGEEWWTTFQFVREDDHTFSACPAGKDAKREKAN